MEQLPQAIVNGVALGGMYAVLVLGFSVIWGVMGVINIAHGEFVIVGAYLAWLAVGGRDRAETSAAVGGRDRAETSGHGCGSGSASCATCSRGWPRGPAKRPGRCREASRECWRSAGR